MSGSISITEQQIFAAVRTVLLGFGLIDQTGNPLTIVQGQVNRVPEPPSPDFIEMWSLLGSPLNLPVLTCIDVQGTGSIENNQLTATEVTIGPVAPGQLIYGAGVPSGVRILSQVSGATGGAGLYNITPCPTIAAQAFYSGIANVTQAEELTIQADVHGPSSAENARRIRQLWRSQIGVSAFDALSFPGGPLYTSAPRQVPFIDDQHQYEERWVVDLCLQVNPTVSTTQQFAAALAATVTSVEATYPPT